MPELPEVETVVRGLRRIVVNRQIIKIEILNDKIVANDVTRLTTRMLKATIVDVKRRGKVIVILLNNGYIVLIHFKMTGQLIFIDDNGYAYAGGHPEKVYEQPLPHKHTHLIVTFKDGSRLYYNDLRRFGWVKSVTAKEFEDMCVKELKLIASLGPEPCDNDFDINTLHEKLARRPKAKIFQILLDQTLISGLGNIYVNELLWRQKIHPLYLASKLSVKKLQTLIPAACQLLEEAIEHGGTSDNTFRQVDGKKGSFASQLKVYHREGQACARGDGGIVTRIKIGGRSAFFCPVCQCK